MKGKRIKFFTSESVTEGHPDKICDQISDAIMDALLAQDAAARSCCEVCVTTDLVVVIGEITTTANVDYEAVVRKTIREIGYTYQGLGFNADTCKIIIALDKQSADIANGVDNSSEYKQNNIDINDKIGAGDQGMVFGCACNETAELMPLPISLAHKLTKRLAEVRKKGILNYLYPDGKSQVTVEYHDGKPTRVDAVVISAHHNEFTDLEKLRKDIKNEVILKIIPANLIDRNTKFFINPAGKFVIGGARADGGLTGRKIIVDTYGGYCPHGGGSLSGKDPTKVDRSAAYMARYICKNLIAAGLADRVEMQISYAIGVANPVSVYIDTFGTGKISDTKIEKIVKEVFDLRPKAIIDKLGLQNPIYRQTAAYGHFGRQGFPWEQTDMSEKLVEVSKKYDV